VRERSPDRPHGSREIGQLRGGSYTAFLAIRSPSPACFTRRSIQAGEDNIVRAPVGRQPQVAERSRLNHIRPLLLDAPHPSAYLLPGE